MANTQRRDTVLSLRRGIDVLTAVAAADRPVGITDLSRSLGLAKGSVARLVATLAQENFLVRNPVTAKYRLGMRLWELCGRAVAGLDVREIARPVMERLHAATQETVHITVLSEGGQMVFLEMLDSTRAIRPNVSLGAHLPPHCVANGKAVLAYLSEARLDGVLNGKLRRYTEKTITRKSELRQVLEEVRRRGYATNFGEYRDDVSGLAAPIRDRVGNAVAALGVSVPTSRMTRDFLRDVAPLLVAGAQEVSSALGLKNDGGPTEEERDA